MAKFDGLEPRRFEEITGIEAPEIGPNSILNDSFFLNYRSSDNCGWWPSFTSQAWGLFSKSPENFRAL